MIQVFIIDDHKMIIEGLSYIINATSIMKVIGSAQDGISGIEQVDILKPDIVLLDINMPGLNGIETCKKLLIQNPEVKIIAISMHKEMSLIKMMLHQGAKGYVLKNAGQDEVLKAITTVNGGGNYLGKEVSELMINSMYSSEKIKKDSSPFPSLSRREKEVLQLILKEYTTQEIADKLFISFGTVETHRRNMMIKTGARNTAGLVRVALEYDILNE